MADLDKDAIRAIGTANGEQAARVWMHDPTSSIVALAWLREEDASLVNGLEGMNLYEEAFDASFIATACGENDSDPRWDWTRP